MDGSLRVQSPGDVNNPQLFLSQTAAGDWSRIRLQSGGPAWDIALGPGADPVMSFYNGSSPVLLLEQDGDAWLNQNMIFQPGVLRQMVDLWNGEHAIGVQSWTTYFRTIGGATPVIARQTSEFARWTKHRPRCSCSQSASLKGSS